MDITKIQNAFSPAQELDSPELFVGRKEEIKNGMLSLTNSGSFLCIYGLRGVGKSSIAHQVKNIAGGDETLPKMFDLLRFIPRKKFSYLTHYIKCDKFMSDVRDLLQRILFGDDSSPSLFSLTKSGEKKLESFKKVLQAEGGAKVLGASIGAKGTQESTYGTYVSNDLIQQFKQTLGTIHKDNQDRTGIVIIIDEFDTLANKSGFASIVKTCSSAYVKFVVVGIANSITELIEDHSSIGRQIETIEVDRMPEYELDEILNKAEFRVGREIEFESESRNSLIRSSEGFPYFMHLLGREAMLLAFDLGKKSVDKTIIDELGKRITTGRLTNIYENIYHSAVKNSSQREILLKAFAENENNEIFSEDVYRLVKDLDVTNPSQLMKELTAPDKGFPILIKIRDKYYRFTDPVFKVYARIRNWKFT